MFSTVSGGGKAVLRRLCRVQPKIFAAHCRLPGAFMSQAQPPVAKRVPHSHTHHGVVRDDPYAWLRADNWQEVMQKPETLDGQIRDYLVAENDFYEAEFGQPTAALQDNIYKEIRGRIKEDDS